MLTLLSTRKSLRDNKTPPVQYQYLFMAFLVVELCWQEPAQLLDALTYAILAHLLALSLLLAVPVVTMATDIALSTKVVVRFVANRSAGHDVTQLCIYDG